jgi:hypothetical protein
VLRARPNLFAVLALSAVALGAAVAGCSTSNTPNPTITAPPLASESFTPTPVPSVTVTPTHGPPTPTPTPTSTSSGSGEYTIEFIPSTLTLTKSNPDQFASAVLCDNSPSGSGCKESDSATKEDSTTCGSGSTAIATFDDSLTEYGTWGIDAGPKAGQCQFVIVDYATLNYIGQTATLSITNQAGSARSRLKITRVGGH